MTLMPEVQDALVDAWTVRRSSATAKRRRRRWSALLAVGAVAVSGTAMAATGAWRPVLGAEDRGHPAPGASAVPVEQLQALQVLRRSQQPRDRGPASQAVLGSLVNGEIAGVRTSSVRLLHDDGTTRTVLLTSETVGRDDDAAVGLRRDVLCLEATGRSKAAAADVQGADGRTRHVEHPASPVVAESCNTTQQLLSGGLSVSVPVDDEIRLTGLVPDGVQTVQLHLEDGTTTSKPVGSNSYTATLSGPDEVRETVWLDADGDVIDRDSEPPGP